MTELACEAHLQLQHLPNYLDRITDRLHSFNADISQKEDRIDFRFDFGAASFDMTPGSLVMRANSGDADGLARIKDLLATAVQVYAKEEQPQIVWSGDLADETQLAQFREMTVVSATWLTPLMRRIRLAGERLERFGKYGNMHIRMLFPTEKIPEPQWPTLGRNGLAVWPSEDHRPTPRAYTIRAFSVEEGWMDVDFVTHEGDSVGSKWALESTAGDKVGIMGPVGRPLRQADWYVMGADETGLPALARMLETLPPTTTGVAFVEVADERERQEIGNRTRIELNWIYRNGVAAGADERLANSVLSVAWPDGQTSFGWFAAEAMAAKRVRDRWRSELGLGRDQTLAAAYWRRGISGLMAG